MSARYDLLHRPGRLDAWAPAPAFRRASVRRLWLRRLLRTGIVGLGLAGAGALGVAGYRILRSDGAFAVRQVQVVGLTRHAAAPVAEALRPLRGRNLLALEPQDVARSLSPFPWVRGFLCRRHLPDTLIVEVEERDLLCALATPGGVVEIDGAGNVWPALPGIPGVFAVGAGVDPSDPAVQSLVAGLLKMNLTAQVTGLASAGPGVVDLKTRDGWDLVMDPREDLAAQWSRFTGARAWAEAYAPKRKSMDLRWAGKVVLAPPPAAPEGVPDPEDPQEGGQRHG